MRVTVWGRVWVLVVGGLLWCGAAFGQTTGEIRGGVVDPSGAIIQGAVIVITQVGTDAVRGVTSDKDGSFDVPELAVGTYSVSAEATGFKKFVAKNVVVSIGHVAIVNITLQIGGSAETVTVEANAVQVETTSTQLGAVMTDTSIRELPMNTRNAYSLLQLQAGVQSQVGTDLFFGSGNPGAVSVNGGRGRSNNYMVNGGDGNDIFVNSPAIQPSPDAIEEFRVLTNTFDAEFGRNSGSVVNVVTKSGSNSVHGDVYEFLRNQALNTRGYFDPFLLDYKQNQFGATLGGPIKKDRTFIFGSYEGNRLIQGISTGSVTLPTAAEATGDFSGGQAFSGTLTDANFATILANRTSSTGQSCQQAVTAEGGGAIQAGAPFSNIFPNNKIPTACFDPTAAALYQQYVAGFGTGTITAGPDVRQHVNQFTVRLDHNLNTSGSQKLNAYYYFDDDNTTDALSTFQLSQPGGILPGFPAVFATRVQQWNLSHTWTIGSTSVNEFRFNYFREGQKNLDHPLNTLNSVQDSCVLIPATNCFTDPANPQAGITTNLPGHVGLPYIKVLGGFTIGNNFEGELPQIGNTFQWTDNFTKTFGKHTLKFGGDVRRQRFDQFLFFEVSGQLYVHECSQHHGAHHQRRGLQVGIRITSSGHANSYTQGSAQGEDFRNTALYLFAQDSYKLTSRISL